MNPSATVQIIDAIINFIDAIIFVIDAIIFNIDFIINLLFILHSFFLFFLFVLT